MAENKGLNPQELGFFNYQQGKADKSSEDEGKGRIANALSKTMAYERTPSLFDEDEIADRDKELKQLQELKQEDVASCIDRRDKPVVLSSYQSRIVHALSYALSQEIETSEDVKKKIQNPTKVGNTIQRSVNITALSSLIFGSTRKRYKEIIIKEIYQLARIRQVQILGSGDNKVKLTAPLIMIGRTMEDLSPEKRNNLDAIEIYFGGAFFYGINNRFAIITPKLFEVWSKGGRGTELFSVLLSSIFAVYWHYRQAANKAEGRVKADKNNKRLSKDELQEAIAEARRNAMTYELNVSSIKQRVTTDYDSKRSYKARFYKDLENVIEGFKELDLIADGIVQKGAKGQDKVIFILSESYNFTEKQGEKSTLLLEDKTDDNEPSPF